MSNSCHFCKHHEVFYYNNCSAEYDFHCLKHDKWLYCCPDNCRIETSECKEYEER